MAKQSRWYERLFFGLQLREERCLRLILILIGLLVVAQTLLTNPMVRRWVVLTERYEGQPVTFYKTSNSNPQNGL